MRLYHEFGLSWEIWRLFIATWVFWLLFTLLMAAAEDVGSKVDRERIAKLEAQVKSLEWRQ